MKRLKNNLRNHRTKLIGMASIIWAVLIASGVFYLEGYSLEPGMSASMEQHHWPQGANFAFARDRSTLLLFVHPRCRCSSASLAELERIMARREKAVEAHLIFMVPKGLSEDWQTESPLWKRAQMIPNLTLHIDHAGINASAFGANTSGQTYLFDQDGYLKFSGGITPGRGHQGDNQGSVSIKALLDGETAGNAAFVFGCSLWDTVKSKWGIAL